MKLEPGRPRTRIVIAFGVVALLAKLVLATRTFGTNDVIGFLVFLREYQGSGAYLVYLKETSINHPPFVLRFLVGIDWLVRTTGWTWSFCLRLPGILADLGCVLLLLRMATSPRAGETGLRPSGAALCLVAAAPISVFVSGFHGNTDPIVCFFVLLSVLWLGRGAPVWLAGAAMGAAVDFKVVPLMLWPAVFFWLPGWRARFQYFGTALALVVLGSSPVLFQAPGLVAKKVLGYAGSYGLWGLSRAVSTPPWLAPLSEAFQRYGVFALAAVLLALSVWMNRRASKPPLYRQVGVLFSAFLAFAPAFGPQYLVWLVPWLLAWPLRAVVAYLACSGAFVFVLYTFWSQGVEQDVAVTNWLDPAFWRMGLPWRYANADMLGPWRGELVWLEIVCWLSVVVLFAVGMHRLRREDDAAPAPRGVAS